MSRVCRRLLLRRRKGSLVEVEIDVESDGDGADWTRMGTYPNPRGSGRLRQQRQSGHGGGPQCLGGGGCRKTHFARNKSSFFRNH